ncbi:MULTISPECIES: hypothetical protein [unclassified Duganella]|uniref:hypothetical protein n=1 Tax=unclassified Duganella TaxID=2636909 RepID=UPI000E355DA3|nr:MULTISPECIES: hypothetical protein [unclassified Duganella]RFP11309.1 hypothetical protein D0T23_20540 [Duganella sp. BJB475]RFP29628.1 hypothetical protein D0T21_17295 [Duganella sp. BJB476]
MTCFLVARRALLIVLGLVLAGCAKEDGSGIIGKWRAERVEVMSLKLPLGPEFEITPTKVAVGDEFSIPIASITQHGNQVTLDTDSLIGMTFYFVEPDRMYLELPIMGRIYYQRVKGLAIATATSAHAKAAPPEATPTVISAPPALLRPSAVEQPAAAGANEPGYSQDYAQARSLVKQGDLDGAVRSLNDAFKHGFRDIAQLNDTREFDVLKSDVRYQVLIERYAGQ